MHCHLQEIFFGVHIFFYKLGHYFVECFVNTQFNDFCHTNSIYLAAHYVCHVNRKSAECIYRKVFFLFEVNELAEIGQKRYCTMYVGQISSLR